MVVALATKTAEKSAATKAPAKRRAPRKTAPKTPVTVEVANLEVGDAHAVLTLDDKQFRLNTDLVGQLHVHFDRAYFGLL